MTFLRTPKGYTLAILLPIALIAASFEAPAVWIHLVVTVGAAVLSDLAFMLLKYRNLRLPDGALLTGLILALILAPITPLQISALCAAVAIASKHLIRSWRNPLFNPAAVGLVAATALDYPQSWWGGLPHLPTWWLPLLVAGGILTANRVSKLPAVFGALFSLFGLALAMAILGLGDMGPVFRIPTANALLFLAFFMVTDPPTSPARNFDQVMYGFTIGGISAMGYVLLDGLWFLIAGLLVANAIRAVRSLVLRHPRSPFRRLAPAPHIHVRGGSAE